MKHTIIILTSILLLMANAIPAQNIVEDYDIANDSIAEAEDSIDLDDLTIVMDSYTMQYDMPAGIALNAYVMDEDSVVFDIPESMHTNIDSLLNSWYARNLLKSLDCEAKPVKAVSDTVYAQRLYNMPTIMKMPYNSIVRQYIDIYTNRNKALVSYMLGISEYYMPMIEETIDRYDVPKELKYLPIVESALKPKAVSHVGAKGLWQFMYSTGKLYGLKSNNYIEERFDPAKSTDAAIRYLRDLYKMFQSWDLAIAAYNCGPGNVKKAIKRSGGKNDFWGIYRHLPRETRGYVPTFIAANYIMTYHAEHGICPMEPNIPIATDTLHISKNLHFSQIAELCDIDIEEIRAINPQYIRDIVPGENEACVVRLPHETITRFIELEDSIYCYKEETFFPKDKVEAMLKEAKASYAESGNLVRHKIRVGETLGSIARKYRVSVKNIQKWNNIKGTNIRAGKYLKIYK